MATVQMVQYCVSASVCEPISTLPCQESGLMKVPTDDSPEAIEAGVSALNDFVPADLLHGRQAEIVAAILAAAHKGHTTKTKPGKEVQAGVRSNCLAESISDWPGDRSIRISSVNIEPRHVEPLRPCTISVGITAEVDGDFEPTVAILIMTRDGFGVTRLLSPTLQVPLRAGESSVLAVTMDSVMLLPRDYVFSVALFSSYHPDDPSTAVRHQILSRSFRLDVIGPKSPGLARFPGEFRLLDKDA